MTFGNGMEIREPIFDLDDAAKRLVWSAEVAGTTHYNASCRFSKGTTEVVDSMDCRLLPHDQKDQIEAMMEQGMAVMKKTLDLLVLAGRSAEWAIQKIVADDRLIRVPIRWLRPGVVGQVRYLWSSNELRHATVMRLWGADT